MLYPNPTTGSLYIDKVKGPVQFKVFDLLGRLVESGTRNTDGELSIDLGKIAPGTYLVRLQGKTLNYAGKIVKE